MCPLCVCHAVCLCVLCLCVLCVCVMLFVCVSSVCVSSVCVSCCLSVCDAVCLCVLCVCVMLFVCVSSVCVSCCLSVCPLSVCHAVSVLCVILLVCVFAPLFVSVLLRLISELWTENVQRTSLSHSVSVTLSRSPAFRRLSMREQAFLLRFFSPSDQTVSLADY